MKFSHSLQFNCVPEWSESYLSYGGLKRALYAIERAIADSKASKPAESAEADFLKLFEAEMERVKAFYRHQEAWCVEEANRVRGKAAEAHAADPESLSVETSESLALSIKRLYVTLSDLKDYLELNRTGFTRIIQKYERYVPRASEKALIAKLDAVLPPFEPATLDPIVAECESVYAVRCLGSSVEAARRDLQSLLRERVMFERSTVWQEMVEMERRVSHVEPIEKGGCKEEVSHSPVSSSASPCAGQDTKKACKAKAPLWPRILKLGVSVAVFLIVLWKMDLNPKAKTITIPTVNDKVPVDLSGYAKRAGAMCMLAIMFWCLEVIPLFATAVLVPFLATILNVIPPSAILEHGAVKAKDLEHAYAGLKGKVAIAEMAAALESELISREKVAKFVFSSMFSPSVMLLIGGFSIASALSKHGIAKRMATAILGRAGRSPAVVLIVIMAITAAFSTFISNVAAPVLVFTLVQPLLRALGVDSPLAKSIVLGIAYAANVGGFMSPISSPQNIITTVALDEAKAPAPSTPQWMMASLLCAPLCLGVTFMTLRFFYPASKSIPDVLTVVKPNPEPLSRKQWMTAIVSTLGIIGLVATDLPAVKAHFGTLGVMAVAPMVAFFGLGLLGKDDFNGFMWNVVIMAMGGSAMGAVANYSGLLNGVAEAIKPLLMGRSFFLVLTLLSFVMLIVATFVSHSVSSAVLAPLIAALIPELGFSLSESSIAVMITCFVCSIGMGMPISGFPNMTAMSIEDALGRSFIDAGDFAKTGLLASFLCLVILLTAGYGIFSFIFH